MHVFTACLSVFMVLKPPGFLCFNQHTTSLTTTDKKYKSNKAVPLIKPSSTRVTQKENILLWLTVLNVLFHHIFELANSRNAGRSENLI